MVTLRSSCLVLVLLFTSLALRSSSVHAQQGMEIVKNENGIAETGAKALFVSRKLVEGVPVAAVVTENKRLGGRKLVLSSILKKNTMEEVAVKGETAKISGEDMNASKKPLGASQKNIQRASNLNSKHDASQLKSQDSEAVSNCGSSLKCSSRARKLDSPEYHDHLHKAESQKLLEASNEIVALMHKDYSGMNRRKPPINNQEPLQRNQKP